MVLGDKDDEDNGQGVGRSLPSITSPSSSLASKKKNKSSSTIDASAGETGATGAAMGTGMSNNLAARQAGGLAGEVLHVSFHNNSGE